MRHRKKSEKFSRPRAQRKALIKSLLRAIIINEQIVTTESKAKGMRGWIDKIINLGKENSLHSKRLMYKILGDHSLVKYVYDKLAPRFNDRTSGYTRVIDKCIRKGDGAKLSILEFVKLEKKIKHKATKEEKNKNVQEAQLVNKDSSQDKDKPKEGLISGMKKIFHKSKKDNVK